MAFRIGSKRRAQQEGKVKGRKRRAFVRLIGALILLGVLLDELPPLVNGIIGDDSSQYSNYDGNKKDWSNKGEGVTFKDKEAGIANALRVAGVVIQVVNDAKQQSCNDYDCWAGVYAPIPEEATNLDMSNKQAHNFFREVVDATELSKNEQEKLVTLLYGNYLELLSATTPQEKQPTTLANVTDSKKELEPTNQAQEPTVDPIEEAESDEAKSEKPVYSLIELAKGIFNDLGLGFGWAALYFTVFTSKWNGQTPGKRLFGIRVLQLDGTGLSLWDSFGRYGGYGAGLATGLLGFLQIYWDANRQAIQDKISATVVIDEKKVVDEDVVEAARLKIEEYKAQHQHL
ncbi:RDD family protein [Thalassomonas sp. M1454]|nr:RDD family protein [Thalassomonas sp. M1454]